MSVWDPADSVPLRMTVTDEDGAPANTDSVRFFITAPNGDIGTPQTATNAAGTGLYDTPWTSRRTRTSGSPACTCGALSRRDPSRVRSPAGSWWGTRTAGPVWTPPTSTA